MKRSVWILALMSLGMNLSTIATAQTARLQTVTQVTSDAIPGRARFAVATDEQGDLLGMVYYSSTPGVDPAFFNLLDLRQGVVIKHDKEHNIDVVTLSISDGFDAKSGGELRLNFVVNGLTMSSRFFAFEAVRSGDQWELHTSRSRGFRFFSHMFIQGNRWFGKVVGVSRILVGTTEDNVQ